ncbi:MAG TPA: outer membrane beta-barrel protein [Ferruginibacter sp.]|nr:outer membrane beta-barrel protein [Ferruginibacter sp.]HNL64828.1 outer membrane beta-barrel protein [Ferruginibacter sp.]
MRLKPALLVLLFSLGFMVTQAQTLTLKGRLLDKDSKTPISGATVTLIAQKDSLNPKTVLTNAKGEFAFTGLVVDKYRLLTSMLDYDVVSQVINLQASNKEPLVFNLSKQPKNLAEVSVKAKKPVVQQKGDTLEFNASELKVNPDANAEDMIKKLPGVTIDKDGNVTSGGDQIRKVTVDGRDFFGDDATAALRNLPASVIDKIQVFDKLSDQAQFTGFDDGNSIKSINIVTKQGMRNGQFGRVYAGVGTQGTYNAGGNVSLFKNNLRLTFVGLTNNVNQQNFASQDLLGVTSSGGGGGGRGGGRGGGGNFGGGGFGGNNNNFTVGQQNGISKTNSFGLNFSDIWGKKKKAEISGSYFFNNSNTSNDQLSNTENFQLSGKNQYYNENAVSSSKNFNHRINFRLNYKINDKNSIIITPNLSFQDNTAIKDISGYNTYSPTDSISRSINNSDSKNFGYNFSNNILFRHSFAKRGRTLSVNFNTTLNKRDGDTYIYNINDYYTPGGVSSDSLQQYTGLITSGYQLGANVSYTEPIGKKGQLQISYTPSYAKNKSDQEVYQYDHVGGKYTLFDDSLSNKFDNVTIKHNTGVTYRLGDRDNMFSVGLSYQYTELTSDRTYPSPVRVSKNFNNVLPNLMWTKKFNARNSIRVFYRANTNTPSVTQLQDVYNNNNPLFVTAGNPNLKQQVGNVLSARYTYTNTAKSKSLFFNVFLQQNSNYITNATYTATKDSVLNSSVTLYKGSQLSKPVNVDGYWSLRSFITYSMPLKFMKSNLSINGGFTYGNTPGLINNIRNNSKSYVYNAGVVLASNISEYVDFNINYSVNFNNVTNSIQPSLDNKYVQQSAGAQLNLLSKKGWFIQNDISNQSYSGLSGGFNQRYWLWNAGIGKKFLKKQQAELKLTVFDLLKQNQSITRTATDSYIQDVQNQVLRQYFMLTFTYNLKNFGTAKPGNNSGFERERMGGSGGGFRPF